MIQDLGQPIAYGRTAEIYAWHPAKVVKLYYDWVDLEKIKHEARVCREIHAGGLPAPAVGEIIWINDRYGLVYERIYGESMWKKFQRKPWNWSRYAYRAAELQVAVHQSSLQVELPSQKKLMENNIRQADSLPDDLRVSVLSALEAMPEEQKLCHGDFWPGNILITSRGEYIIDWLHASLGSPLADLARTTNLAFGLIHTRQVERPFLSYGASLLGRVKNSFQQAFFRVFYPTYLEYYFELAPGGKDQYLRWLPIVAAARLADNIPELEKMLIEQVENNL
jgi:uncharacterized protein (TIGR02172 family)